MSAVMKTTNSGENSLLLTPVERRGPSPLRSGEPVSLDWCGNFWAESEEEDKQTATSDVQVKQEAMAQATSQQPGSFRRHSEHGSHTDASLRL